MRAKLAWQLGSVIVVLAILAGGWFLFVSPQLDQVSANDASRVGVGSQNSILQTQIVALSKVDRDALASQLAAFQSGVPETPQTQALIRDIKATVESTGAELQSVALQDPQTFAPAGPGVTSDGRPAPATSASGSASSSSTVATVAPLPILSADVQDAVKAGLIDMSLSVGITGNTDQVLAAAAALQTSAQRKILISGVSFNPTGPTGDPDEMIATLDGYVWIRPAKPIAPVTSGG